MACAACGKGRKKGGGAAAAVELLNMPQPAIWGPALWTILHVAAERAGQNEIIPIRLDEVRELELLIRSFPATLPCAQCQVHSRTYIQEHKIDWSGQTGPEARDKIRRWLYNFHDHVNHNKATPTESIPYEEVELRYTSIKNVKVYYDIVIKELQNAINFNIVKHDAAQKFRRHLGALRSFIGI
jgi:hypothetical protein